ncbi:MAG TPA: hypothetical protein VJ715_12815, partial [Pyrinomonadaceae bacterium]|nr:hypothetical protein [Pyrinomonadaceae bacterium]
MRSFRLFILLTVAALILAAPAPAPHTSASATLPDEAPQRAPFSLELPELGGEPITAAQARIPSANLRTLRFKVKQPYAKEIDPGKIYTHINGEAAGTIQEVRTARDGRIVICDLESKPRFRLHPGKNVIEISAIDHSNNSYYASYVLLTGGATAPDSADAAGATLESIPTEQGTDRQPPDISMTTPNGPVRLLKATDVVRVRGTATDDASAIASVKING